MPSRKKSTRGTNQRTGTARFSAPIPSGCWNMSMTRRVRNRPKRMEPIPTRIRMPFPIMDAPQGVPSTAHGRCLERKSRRWSREIHRENRLWGAGGGDAEVGDVVAFFERGDGVDVEGDGGDGGARLGDGRAGRGGDG